MDSLFTQVWFYPSRPKLYLVTGFQLITRQLCGKWLTTFISSPPERGRDGKGGREGGRGSAPPVQAVILVLVDVVGTGNDTVLLNVNMVVLLLVCVFPSPLSDQVSSSPACHQPGVVPPPGF